MKITENEVEVAKHQSVIAPIVVVGVVLFVCGSRDARCYSIINARKKKCRSAPEDTGSKLTGCCLRRCAAQRRGR